jgi:hypothetical protein
MTSRSERLPRSAQKRVPISLNFHQNSLMNDALRTSLRLPTDPTKSSDENRMEGKSGRNRAYYMYIIGGCTGRRHDGVEFRAFFGVFSGQMLSLLF